MSLQILAQNVRRLRTARRFSQNVLAEKAGLSLSSVKKLELEKSEPRINTVQAIAQALEVRLQDLFLPVRELKTVRFRSNKKMTNRENILAEISRWIDDYNFLENVLQKEQKNNLLTIGNQCSNADRNSIIKSALSCREAVGLDSKEPIHDICGLLESAGIKVKSVKMATDSFFGISIGEEDGGPAIVVNIWDRIPVERRIFSAAHELGHLMLHLDAFDIKETDENKDEENEADIFAGYFLLPDKGFLSEWNDALGQHWIDRVLKVKRIFRVSYKTILYRLIELGMADKSIWAKFNYHFRLRYKRKLTFRDEPYGIDPSEPYGMKEFDFYEDQFSRFVVEAVEREKISLSKGAEILSINIEEMRDILVGWEVDAL